MKKIISVISLLTGVISLAVIATPVLAVNAHAEQAQQNASQQTSEKSAEAKAKVAAKLDDIKLKVCQKREAAIKKTVTKMRTRGEVQFKVFTKIAERTEKFYTDKGRTVANYDELVQAVKDAKTKAQKTITDATQFGDSFSCTADSAATFKDEIKTRLHAEIEALKAYRTAVRNLIVGVKSAQGQTSRDQANETLDNTPTQQEGRQ